MGELKWLSKGAKRSGSGFRPPRCKSQSTVPSCVGWACPLASVPQLPHLYKGHVTPLAGSPLTENPCSGRGAQEGQ